MYTARRSFIGFTFLFGRLRLYFLFGLGSDDEDIKRKIKDLVKELKDIENKNLITSESRTHLYTRNRC
ncbi:hypothetical protein evm_013859 [Chilo suppressalis]|nr:hypothetical protein evm_013859 [Chilo suppressalis]